MKLTARDVLTAERAREIFSYDPETGNLRWKAPTTNRRIVPGSIAGAIRSPNDYLVVGVYGHQHLVHRVIWLVVYGKWPDHEIDHIDGVRWNNRPGNLREVTHAENMLNLHVSRGVSGLIGVSWAKREQKWHATIKSNGRQKSLGYYDDPLIAQDAYVRAKAEIHPRNSACSV